MKITDVTLTMFKWEGLPAALPKKHSVQPGSSSQIGLLTISTDAGVDGHAFLGTSNRSAELDALSLITYLKPVVMGRDPLAREKLHETMIFLQNNTTMRAIGAVDVALWDIGGKVAGLPILSDARFVSGEHSGVCEFAASGYGGRLCGGGCGDEGCGMGGV